jgi:uncharacterized membrane protein YtjA (UPF0391 family)
LPAPLLVLVLVLVRVLVLVLVLARTPLRAPSRMPVPMRRPLWASSYRPTPGCPTGQGASRLSQPLAAAPTLGSPQNGTGTPPAPQQDNPSSAPHWSPAMLHYAVVFFVIALIAAVFGFGGIAASAVGIAKILFVVFAVLAIASFLFGLIR